MDKTRVSKGADLIGRLSLIVFLIFFGLLSFSSVSQARSKSPRIAVIDIEKVYASYKQAQATRKSLQAERSKRQAELAKKQAQLRKLREEYQKKKDSLSAKQKKEYEQKIVRLARDIRAFIRQSNTYLVNKARVLTKERLEEIAQAINDYAKKNGYDLVLDKKSVPYFKDSYDITDGVISELNKRKAKRSKK